MDPDLFEERFELYLNDLSHYLPDGIFEVDLSLLQMLGLLSPMEEFYDEAEGLTHSFYVVESKEKLTLYNQRFIVWIVPQVIDQETKTITFVASNSQKVHPLEMAFCTSGIYNHSGLVLRILEKYLQEIEENERELDRLNP